MNNYLNYLNNWTTPELLNYLEGRSCLINFKYSPCVTFWTPNNNVIIKDINIKLQKEIRQKK